MPNLDRRNLLHAAIALTVPFGGSIVKPKQDSKEDKEETMQLQYLEIVTPKVDELCKQYSAVHGVTFSEPEPKFGNARTAKLSGGGLIGIRGPMRKTETPVIRPYVLVKDLDKAVTAAADSGAEVAIQKMEIPGGHGTIAIVIQGGIECGLWQL